MGKEFQLECLTLQDADSACGSYMNLAGHAQEDTVFHDADGVVQLCGVGLQRSVGGKRAVDDVVAAVGEIGGAD